VPKKASTSADAPQLTKTQAIRNAVKADPQKPTREITDQLVAEGWDVNRNLVSVVRSNMGKKKRKKKQAAPAPAVAAPAVAEVPAVPKDAVSLALLQKAKKLVKELGGVKQAKAAVDALVQLLD
jgi:hypothetical protein